MSTAKTDAWISDFGIGLGAAALISGGVLFALGGEKQEESSSPPPVGVPPKEATGKWNWQLAPGAHGAQGLLSRSF